MKFQWHEKHGHIRERIPCVWWTYNAYVKHPNGDVTSLGSGPIDDIESRAVDAIKAWNENH